MNFSFIVFDLIMFLQKIVKDNILKIFTAIYFFTVFFLTEGVSPLYNVTKNF